MKNNSKGISHFFLSLASCGAAVTAFCILALSSCSNYSEQNSPTTGKLNVYYDESLALHAKNQALTFESQYPHAHLKLFSSTSDEAVQALYTYSAEAIMISRQLTGSEKKRFESKGYFPKFSPVAVSGVALVTNSATAVDSLTYEQVITLLGQSYTVSGADGTSTISVLFDKNNSSLVHYLSDSVLTGRKFSASCNILGSSRESINYVAQHKNTIAFIDFAWLSDADDSMYRANKGLIKFIAISPPKTRAFAFPDQSSFKLGTYPLARTVYIYRKTGDFTLAKGFESFVAGPKGQLIFLKQGLLPTRQSERKIEVSTRPLNEN